MPNVLIVGATRGLGAALTTYYSSHPHSGAPSIIYATTRNHEGPSVSWARAQNVHWITDIDLSHGPAACDAIATQVKNHLGEKATGKLDTVIITAGYFATENYGDSKWDEEVKMYTLSSIAPVFVIEALDKAGLFHDHSQRKDSKPTTTTTGTTPTSTSHIGGQTKIVLVSSESGSITLRHAQEGGGNFGHHGSKAATNMVGKQLSFDLAPKGIAVAIVHPSFMRTEMTKGVGFDKFWDGGGALEPAEAAQILADWVENEFGLEKTGTYWAPRGTRDIGNWDVTMGKDTGKEGPVELPW